MTAPSPPEDAMTPKPLLLAAILSGVVSALPAAQPPGRTTIRVLCYNIHHGKGTDGKIDLRRLAKVIAAARPDLVALQEVDNKCQRSGKVDQTTEIARQTGLNGRFGKQIDFEGGEYGQAVLSRFPLDELTVHWLPGTPERQRRIAAEARVKVGGVELSFVGTHLHHQRDEFREQQAAKLNELFGKADHPVILAGDLNADPQSKPLDILREKWTVATAGPSLFTYPAAKPAGQIDYVLCRPGKLFRVVEASVIAEAVASNHRPVLAVVELVP
jgi:endonuclease/exonuclease/phosphatase family metal-dependent hydrolase